METVRTRLKNTMLVLLVAIYFVAANGMVLEFTSHWYSTGGQATFALHSGPSRNLPVPSLTERAYLPQTSPLFVLSVALLAHTLIYPVERVIHFHRLDGVLPSSPAVLTSSLSERAPPAA
jgi:hypothetical protein